MTLRILLAQGLSRKSAVEDALNRIWKDRLEPVLLQLGHSPLQSLAEAEALVTFQNFLEELVQAGITTKTQRTQRQI